MTRVRSTHDVYRATPYVYGIDTTPCFCWADSTHPIGQEQARILPSGSTAIEDADETTT